MSRDLLDEAGYLQNFDDFLDLVNRVYQGADIYDVLMEHRLIVVGGQALAFWYARYVLDERRYDQFQAAYSEDLDFFGVRSSVGFCEAQLELTFKRPENFDSTVNLAMVVCEIGTPAREVIIDIIHQVGGLENEEVFNGVHLLQVGDVEVPVINPLLCLKSRIHNFYAPYKADKLNELSRIRLCMRFLYAYILEQLSEEGWGKTVSKLCQAIFDLCLGKEGKLLYCNQGIDLLECIPHDSRMNPQFVEKQLPRMVTLITQERERMHKHLLRFNEEYAKKFNAL